MHDDQQKDLQDRDTSVGRGEHDPGDQATPPSAGHAAPPSAEGAIGLAGAHGAVSEGGPVDVRKRPDTRDVPATGIETGNASLGSSTNAAVRPDQLDSPRSR